MAGDWIKMRVGLTTNPRVLRIAECLIEDSDYLKWSALSFGMGSYPPANDDTYRIERHAALRVTRYVTVTALLRFWGYANEHIKGEFIAGILPEDIDEIVGVPGFSSAMEAAGWVEFDNDGGISIPNFDEHNTSADARSGGADRQKRYRERQRSTHNGDCVTRDVTRDVTVTHREEKRREEINTPIVPTGDEQAVISAYHDLLPNCKRVEVHSPKRKKRIASACKLARSVCSGQGWPYEAPKFWRAYFAECAKDPWMRGEVANPNNSAWKQNLEVLIAEDRFASVMDSAIAALRGGV